MIFDSTVLITVETLFVVISGLFLIFYGSKLRSLIIQERTAGEIVSHIVASLEKKIHERDDRIGDLLFRIDLLEARVISPVNKHPEVGGVGNELRGDAIDITTSHDITSTEITALQLLLNGSKMPKEIQKELGRSREHVSRLLKGLFEKGYVTRDQNHRPFVYSLTNSGKELIIGLMRS